MPFVKRTYVDQETVITAENLNAIQDELIRLGQDKADASRLAADEAALKSGAEADAEWHLGFYLDANGDLCQVDN